MTSGSRPVQSYEQIILDHIIPTVSNTNLDLLTTNKVLSSKIKGNGGSGNEDLQTILYTLSTLLVETAGEKERLDGVSDVVKSIENNLVTKIMLADTIRNKADKNQMSTKVSYDEFGKSIDELTTRIQNLLIEFYQENQKWKQVTEQFREQLGIKVDQSQFTPVTTLFKNQLKKLDEKVNYLAEKLEEPDTAGTRKKLLKGYNCISCDRYTNISGVTNTAQVPVLEATSSKGSGVANRVYDLHKMRQQQEQQKKTSKSGGTGRNMNLVSEELHRSRVGGGKSSNSSSVVSFVNRYVGGSHTSTSGGIRKSKAAAQKRPATTGTVSCS